MRRTALHDHLERKIVHGPDAELFQVGDFSQADGLCVPDVIIKEGIGIGVGGIEHPSERVHEIVGGYGPSVVPLGAGTQMKCPFHGVIGDVVMGGRGRYGLPQLVPDEQCFEREQGGFAVVEIDLDVEAARFGTHHAEDLLVQRRRIRWKDDTDRVRVLGKDWSGRQQYRKGE